MFILYSSVAAFYFCVFAIRLGNTLWRNSPSLRFNDIRVISRVGNWIGGRWFLLVNRTHRRHSKDLESHPPPAPPPIVTSALVVLLLLSDGRPASPYLVQEEWTERRQVLHQMRTPWRLQRKQVSSLRMFVSRIRWNAGEWFMDWRYSRRPISRRPRLKLRMRMV